MTSLQHDGRLDELQAEAHDERWEAHRRSHAVLEQNIDKALAGVERERALHVTAHEAAHAANERATQAALIAHAKEHELEAMARDKAEAAVNLRLAAMNEVREQLKEQTATFARVEIVQALTDRIIAIEKLDIKGEGKSLGQGAVIAAIVAAIGVSATIVSLVVVLANLVGAP